MTCYINSEAKYAACLLLLLISAPVSGKFSAFLFRQPPPPASLSPRSLTQSHSGPILFQMPERELRYNSTPSVFLIVITFCQCLRPTPYCLVLVACLAAWMRFLVRIGPGHSCDPTWRSRLQFVSSCSHTQQFIAGEVEDTSLISPMLGQNLSSLINP